MLLGHDGLVPGLVFTPDGLQLVSAGWDKTIRLWDLSSGREAARFRGHTGYVIGLAISPDGRALASVAQDGTIRLWDVKSCVELHRFKGLTDSVTRVAFSPDGARLAAAEFGGTQVWDVKTFGQVALLPQEGYHVNDVRFSGDGKRLVTVATDDGASLWDARSAERLARYPVKGTTTWSADLSPDGSTLALGSQAMLRVCDTNNGPPGRSFVAFDTLATKPDFGGLSGVVTVRFSHDGRLFLAAGGGNVLWVWDTRTWNVVCRYRSGHRNRPQPDEYFTAAAFSPNGLRIGAASSDGKIRIWTLPGPAATRPIE